MKGPKLGSARSRLRLAGVALVAMQVVALAAPASAAVTEVRRDTVDGSSYFTWDADTGTFPPDGDYGAAQTITRGDRVRFFADAQPVEGAPAGERLLGTLSLRLKGSKPVRYSGTFTFIVQWGEVVFHRLTQEASFTLRPTVGKRTKVLRFPFDLEADGMYAVGGRFRAGTT